jgi:hypothetical protein
MSPDDRGRRVSDVLSGTFFDNDKVFPTTWKIRTRRFEIDERRKRMFWEVACPELHVFTNPYSPSTMKMVLSGRVAELEREGLNQPASYKILVPSVGEARMSGDWEERITEEDGRNSGKNTVIDGGNIVVRYGLRYFIKWEASKVLRGTWALLTGDLPTPEDLERFKKSPALQSELPKLAKEIKKNFSNCLNPVTASRSTAYAGRARHWRQQIRAQTERVDELRKEYKKAVTKTQMMLEERDRELMLLDPNYDSCILGPLAGLGQRAESGRRPPVNNEDELDFAAETDSERAAEDADLEAMGF